MVAVADQKTEQVVEGQDFQSSSFGEHPGEPKGTALMMPEPIHYHCLPPNEPHPCDKYGCAREAKFQLGDGYYCHDNAVSHFAEVANKCRKEGFELIEDV